MDVLESNQPISGPHYFRKITKRDFSSTRTVYFLGEEHTNSHQCYKAGYDVNEIIQSALYDERYKVAVFLEMPKNYEEERDIDVVCSAKPVNKPRHDVLNTMRSCLLKERNSHDRRASVNERINFTDIREFFGLLPYNDKEKRAVQCIKKQDKETGMGLTNYFFIHSISNAIQTLHGVDDDFQYLILHKPEAAMAPYEYFVYEIWHRSLVPMSRTMLQYFDQYLESPNKCLRKIVDCFRDTMDFFIDAYSTWRILRSFDQGIASHAIFYGGSSHAKNISDMLVTFGYAQEEYSESPVDIACARAPREFLHKSRL